APGRPAVLEVDVAAIDPPELFELSAKCCIPGLRFNVGLGKGVEHCNAPYALSLLRPRRNWPRRRAAEQHDEVAPVHSITSSASASSLSGIWRPRALAVLRLMTRSYLVGACTGRSAGFSPLRMRSTYPAARRYWSI